MILDLLIYFTFYYIAYLSIYAYGKNFRLIFFQDKKALHPNEYYENEYVDLFFGISFLTILSWLYNFSFGLKNEWINFLIIIIGFVVFIFGKKQTKKKIFYFLPIVLFIGIIIYNNHNDFYLYHFQNIIELDGQPKIGIGNLNPKYVYASIFVYFESLFNFPWSQHKYINIPRYLVFVIICGYLCSKILGKKDSLIHFFSSIFLFFILIKFKRFSEHGYDYIAIFFTIFIFIEYFYSNLEKKYNFQNILFFFTILVSFKITGIFFLPFLIYAVYINYSLNLRLKYFLRAIIPGSIVAAIFLINSFLNSGCIFYPIKNTCFNSKTISWSVNYDQIFHEGDVAKKWAKGFYHQNKDEKIGNYQEYLKYGRWILSWFKSHFLKKIIDPILIFISIFLIFYFLSRSTLNVKKRKKPLLALSLISLLFWLFTMPQLRFGYFYVLLNLFFLSSIFFKKEIVLNNKTKIFTILAFIFFNIHNLNRIYSEYREISYFPWYQNVFYRTTQFQKNGISYTEYVYDKKNNKIPETNKDNIFPTNLLVSGNKINLYKKYNFIIIENLN